MIAALLFLTTANFWVYAGNTERKAFSAISDNEEEEQEAGPSAPNPVEEKSSNTLQNLSEYLHDHQHTVLHPLCISSFGNRHDIINFPIHHLELVTPPPKTQG